jgi:SAM-dependent methyltransferase
MITCPACGSTSSRQAGSRAPGFAAIAGGETFTQPDYSILGCGDCGILYRAPVPSEADLSRYYARTDFRKWEISGFFPTEACALKFLRELPNGSAILDFGCSSGRLLAPLAKTHRCYGVEVNQEAASAAAQKGITIVTNLEESTTPTFDAIVLVDLFEHIAHPMDLLRTLSSRLNARGMMIVVTGNGDAAACRRDPALFWYFRTIEHLSMLTRRHADFVCNQLGLRLDRWIELSHYDLSWRERIVQRVQNFLFWQFRDRTRLARTALRFLPGMRGLKTGILAPTCTCTRDHLVAIFRRT